MASCPGPALVHIGKVHVNDAELMMVLFVIAVDHPFRAGHEGLLRMRKRDDDFTFKGSRADHIKIHGAVHTPGWIENDSRPLQRERSDRLRPAAIGADEHPEEPEVGVEHR